MTLQLQKQLLLLIFPATFIVQSAWADTELIARWSFEPEGFTEDSSGNGHALSSTNAIFRTDDTPPGIDSDSCLYLSGNGSMQTIAPFKLDQYGEKNLRVSWWMKNATPPTGSPTVVCELGPVFNQDQGAFLVLANGQGATQVPDRPGAVGIMLEEDGQWIHANYDTLDNTSGQWEHFRVEYRPAGSPATTVQVWRNGVLIPDADPAPWNRHYARDSGSGSGDPLSQLANETLYVGARAGNKFPFFGLVDNMRIFDPVSGATIAQWEFDGQGEAFLSDSSGNGYDLVHAADSMGTILPDDGTPDGSGCAYFDGTGYLQTVKPLNLSAYDRVKISYSMYNFSPPSSPAGILLEQGENDENQPGFVVTVNEIDTPGGMAGQVGVKFPGIVRDQLPHSAMRWWDWETDVWEDYEIEFDLAAENYEDTVLVTHNGNLLDDSVYSAGDLDGEGNKQMVGSSGVGVSPWEWSSGKTLFIGARNGSSLFFDGFIDELTIEAFDEGTPPSSIPEPSLPVFLFSASFAIVVLRPRSLRRGSIFKTKPIAAIILAGIVFAAGRASAAPLQICTFKTDVTPPLGSPLCDGLVAPAATIVDRLSAGGMVIFSDELPIVICSLDWIGVGNGGYQEFRQALAAAAGTTEDRVALHCIHQHDAPGADFEAEVILADAGISGAEFNPNFARVAINRTAEALAASLDKKLTVTHIGTGTGIVEQIASNRRILDPTGTYVERMRFTACTDPIAIAAPEGTIDPKMQLISFWNGDQPLASMTHYATHPQSYYGQGGVSYDFVGMARTQREQALPDVAHIHFNGAGGNIGAGKYNTGDPANRPVLAGRLADGMEAAWNNQEIVPIDSSDVNWEFEPVILPPRAGLEETSLLATVNDSSQSERTRVAAARNLAFLRRMENSQAININCLDIGPASVLYMPGELFVEYQLAAQDMASDRFVAMAAYGDYGPGYICTEIAYSQGGYEAGTPSRTAPEVEDVLMQAMESLLIEITLDGDANRDGFVDVSDLGILATHYDTGSGKTWEQGDFTGDGVVDVSDLGILATNYGNTAQAAASASVPEPTTTIGLLGLCLAAICFSARCKQ